MPGLPGVRGLTGNSGEPGMRGDDGRPGLPGPQGMPVNKLFFNLNAMLDACFGNSQAFSGNIIIHIFLIK